jgi:tripartite ATP-independent transporter DctP family solute receptor
MKRWMNLLLVSVMVFLLAACGAATEEKPEDEKQAGGGETAKETRTIRAGIGLNDKHPQYLGLLKFKEIVEQETNGAIKVETYHSGQLGDDRTMMEALQLGTQEVTIPSTAPIANFVPQFSIFDFPFIFPNEQVADQVLDGAVGQELLDMLPAQNLIGLAYWENGFRNLTNNTRAVASVEDFNGLKIRTMENQVHLEAFRALGANPTPMAFTELFTAMQQGTVDGQENPIATIYLQKFYEVQEHVSLTNHVYSPFVFLISKKFWDESTPEEQEILRNAAEQARDEERKLNREANAQYLDELKAAGMTVTEVTPENLEKMRATVQPVLGQFEEKIGKDLVQRVYDAIKEAK